MEKIKLHSITDLITNSSTTIYTYSDGSPKVLEELVNEILVLMGSDKKCADVFNMSVMLEDIEDYLQWADKHPDKIPEEFLDAGAAGAKFDALLDGIYGGIVGRPDWFADVEKAIAEDTWSNSKPTTTLYVVAKDPKYENLAKLVVKFLYSTSHGACYNG